MKTKKKMIALVKISVVLCSVFLVAFPGIAAQEQNQEMQKASTSEVTTASEDDYVLDIYGNANEDDTIDMGDVVYIKLAIFGKKPKTELCDAKYDGRINVLDVIQTKLIILGKEKELTIAIPADPLQAAQIVTVHKPVERIVVLSSPEACALRSVNAADKIVGVGKGIRDNAGFFPEFSKLPIIGQWMGPGLDYEAILNLKPDLFIPFVRNPRYMNEDKLPGVKVIGMGLRDPRGFTERVRLLGYILDKNEEAEEYINWHESWVNTITSQTEALSEDEKPRVFYWAFFQPGGGYKTITKDRRIHAMIDRAGGINVAADLKGVWPKVDPEWVLDQNPDIIVARAHTTYMSGGYGTDDPSGMAAAREDILNRLELAKVTAVKNGRVYINAELQSGGQCLIGTAYMAKWYHPELFEDLDPEAIHQEYLTRFQRIDYDLDEHGVFAYPPIEINGDLAGIPDRYKG